MDYLTDPHPDDSFVKTYSSDPYQDRSRLRDAGVDPDSIPDGDLHYLGSSHFLGTGGDLHGYDDLTQSMEMLDDAGDVVMDVSSLTLTSDGHVGGRCARKGSEGQTEDRCLRG